MTEREVFEAALDLPPGGRAAFLDGACAGDAALRERLDALLGKHVQAGSFLEGPVVTGGFTPDTAASGVSAQGESVGQMLAGRYKLLEVIGEGGMGTVWMAQQTEPVKRSVAVKLIKAGMNSKQVLARFEAERQALALMDHPNVAKVHDAGTTPDGRPFFVMELVRGVPITKYCDEHRLTPRQRLELFVPICQAIQHAHQKGIIHRDIKPSNVLVASYDDKPAPKVIDFGVAKATGQQLSEHTLHTGFGAVVGTVEYMSPEQASFEQLDVDTRSDIYSLGILLYELLAGSPPFTHQDLEKAGMLEMLRVIREREPSKPSTRLSTADGLPALAAKRGTEPKRLTAQVRGELDWIVMKALEKDRSRRYETANGLALDVQRFLSDEPVQACPPSVGYRLRKFMRRNQATLTVTGLVFLILLTLAGSIGWVMRDQSVRQTAMEKLAEEAIGQAEGLQGLGQWAEAKAALKRAEGLLAGAEGHSVLAGHVRALLADVDMVARLEEIRLQQGDSKVTDFAYLDADPAYALAFHAYGLDLKVLDPAAAAARIRAAAIREQLVAALDDWVWVKGRADPAGGERLLAVARQADPDEWRNRVRDPAVERDRKSLEKLAAQPEVVALPPSSTVLLARRLKLAGSYQKAIDVLVAAQFRHPGDLWLNHDLASLLLWRTVPPRRDEALGYARAALALRPRGARLYVDVGNTLHTPARLDEAIAAYHKAIDLQPDCAVAYKALGDALAIRAAWDQAIAAYQEGIRLDPKMTNTHHHLAVAYVHAGAWPQAIAALKEAVRLRSDDIGAQTRLAWVLATTPELSLRDAEQALKLANKMVKAAPRNGNTWEALGAARYRNGDWPGAIAAMEKARQIFAERSGSYQSFWLAMAHWQQGDQVQARHWYDRGVEWLEKNQPAFKHNPWLFQEELRRFQSEAEQLLRIKMPAVSKASGRAPPESLWLGR